MTSDIDAIPQESRSIAALSLGVHAAFYVLVLTSAVRFVTRHAGHGAVTLVVLLSIMVTLGYTASILAVHRWDRGARAMTFGILVVWGVLVLLAPSFAWCAFPLFFLCRAHVRPPLGYVFVAAVSVLTAVALFLLSDGGDWATLVGPPCVAFLLTLVFDMIEADSAARLRLQQQVAAAQVRADIRRAIDAMRTGLAHTRSLVHDLASPHLGIDGFHAGVLAELRGQVSDAEMTISGEPVEVPVDVSHAVSRITRSAAANIGQHANAQRVGLTLTYLPRALLLDIFDDGSGFDQSAVADPSAQGGYGLRAMRQRVAQLGGSFTIETAPGEGTVVAVEIPLHVPAGARS